ncbi:MAG: branched-chain amino acid transporter ATP-binding protein [Ilumatobacteraceae bacterium]|nr:branched-chain amino acid transporter ATP-binding protein [Ilumatobacteraceae bacterium]
MTVADGGPSSLVPAGADEGPLLCVDRVCKSFGGVRANTDVSFGVRAGTVASLIGPNGAGKTTLFNALTGFGAADSGSVTFGGRHVQRMAAHRIARLGMVRTFQSIKMLSGLTVYESMLVVRPGRPCSRTEMRRRADEVLGRLRLTPFANRVCSELPLLAQRTIEVARALMCEPTMILLDEPTAGATVSERQQLAELIGELRIAGTTVMVIEHNVPFVISISDQIVVLDFGKVVADGTPAEVVANPVVQEIYLGQ